MPAENYDAATGANDASDVVRAFGVEYLHQTTTDGGDLWFTRWGWPVRQYLTPERWFTNDAYTKSGTRLGYSTGHVYRMSVTAGTRKLTFVVKHSRVAQRVASSGLIEFGSEMRTSFSSPFEELGQLNLLRESHAPRAYVFTKRPLAIFSPGTRAPAWMFDRIGHEFSLAKRRVQADAVAHQAMNSVSLEPDRDYITLFEWVNGFNLQELVKMGRISVEEMQSVDREVRRRLQLLGFSVADHKPDHIIVRLDSNGVPRRRNGNLVVALADFELLERVAKNSPVEPDLSSLAAVTAEAS
jgi:hypothetical protein